MNKEMTRKVIEEAVRTGDIDVVLKTIDHIEQVAHKCISELGDYYIKTINNRLVKQKEELTTLLSGLKLTIENDITGIMENGARRDATLEDKLEAIEFEWLMLKENLLESLGVDLYDERI